MQIQAKVEEETLEKHEPTGHLETFTTGNIAIVMLTTSSRSLLPEVIASTELKSRNDRIILNMVVALTIINFRNKFRFSG